jgi:hypothetical protein
MEMTMGDNMTSTQPLIPANHSVYEKNDVIMPYVHRIVRIECALIKRTLNRLGPFTDSQVQLIKSQLAAWRVGVVRSWQENSRLGSLEGLEVKNEQLRQAIEKGLDTCWQTTLLMKMTGTS